MDAYDGTVHLYVFDPADPLVRAYRNLFPGIFTDASAMPADLRAHMRYPETIFRVQAEIYRTYHMRDPDAFYNKADLWDVARGSKSAGRSGRSRWCRRYMIAKLPGEQHARVSADAAVHAAQQGQPDRPDGGPLRRRRIWANWCSCCCRSRNCCSDPCRWRRA